MYTFIRTCLSFYSFSHAVNQPQIFSSLHIFAPLKPNLAATEIWDSLSPALRTSTITDTFLRHLKTHYFHSPLRAFVPQIWITQIAITFPCARLWITFWSWCINAIYRLLDVVQFRRQRWRQLRQRHVRWPQQPSGRWPAPQVPTYALQGRPTKWGHKLMAIILSYLNRVFLIFHWKIPW